MSEHKILHILYYVCSVFIIVWLFLSSIKVLGSFLLINCALI